MEIGNQKKNPDQKVLNNYKNQLEFKKLQLDFSDNESNYEVLKQLITENQSYSMEDSLDGLLITISKNQKSQISEIDYSEFQFTFVSSINQEKMNKIYKLVDLFKNFVINVSIKVLKLNFGYNDMFQLSKLIEKFKNAKSLEITFHKFVNVRKIGFMSLASKISKLKELTLIKIIYMAKLKIYENEFNNLISKFKKLPKLEEFALDFHRYPANQSENILEGLQDAQIKRFSLLIYGNYFKAGVEQKIEDVVTKIAHSKNIKEITINLLRRVVNLSLVQRVSAITKDSSHLKSFAFKQNLNPYNANVISQLKDVFEYSQSSKVLFSIQIILGLRSEDLQQIQNLLTSHSCLKELELKCDDSLNMLLQKEHFNLLNVLQKQKDIVNFKLDLPFKQDSLKDYSQLYQQLAKMSSLRKASVVYTHEKKSVNQFILDRLVEESYSIEESRKKGDQMHTLFNNYLNVEFDKGENDLLNDFLEQCQPTHLQLAFKQYQVNQIEKQISPLINYQNKIKNLSLIFEDQASNSNSEGNNDQLDIKIFKTLLEKQSEIQNLELNILNLFLKGNKIIELFEELQYYQLQFPSVNFNYLFQGKQNSFKMGYAKFTPQQFDSLCIQRKDSLLQDFIVIEDLDILEQRISNFFETILKKYKNTNKQLESIKYFRILKGRQDDFDFWNYFTNNFTDQILQLEINYIPSGKISYSPQYYISVEDQKNSSNYVDLIDILKNQTELTNLKIRCPYQCFNQQLQQINSYKFLNKIQELDITFISQSNSEIDGHLISNIALNILHVNQLALKCESVYLKNEQDVQEIVESFQKLEKLEKLTVILDLDDKVSIGSIIKISKKFQEFQDIYLEINQKSRKYILNKFISPKQLILDLGFLFQNNYFFQMNDCLLSEEDEQFILCEQIKKFIFKLKVQDHLDNINYLIKYYKNKSSKHAQLQFLVDNESLEFFKEIIESTNKLENLQFLQLSMLQIVRQYDPAKLYLNILKQINNQSIVGVSFYFSYDGNRMNQETFNHLARKLKNLTIYDY